MKLYVLDMELNIEPSYFELKTNYIRALLKPGLIFSTNLCLNLKSNTLTTAVYPPIIIEAYPILIAFNNLVYELIYINYYPDNISHVYLFLP
jgi:hypothetical protein